MQTPQLWKGLEPPLPQGGLASGVTTHKELKITNDRPKGGEVVLRLLGGDKVLYVAQAGQELVMILLPQDLSAGTPGVSHHAVLLTSKELGRTRAFPTLCL